MRSGQDRELNLHPVETQPIVGAGADIPLDYLELSFLELIKGLSLAHFLQRRRALDILADVGVKSVKLPPRSPNLNAHAERFVRSVKESCLQRMIWFGERSLRKGIQEFMTHYHTERNHQGLANRLISPEPGHLGKAGVVQRRQRLGGMLNYYYRAAA
jgi:hypothetical protein